MRRHRTFLKHGALAVALLLTPALATLASAQAAAPAGPDPMKVALDTIWVLVTAALVFFMNLGFALVESGFCQSKNTVNILSKNFIVFAISSLAFYVFGWGLMFGSGSPWFGSEGLIALGGADNSPATGDAYQGAYSSIAWTGVPLYAKFFFQLVFAGTAATIVSGAVAERIKYLSFIVFSFLLVAFVYPVTGHWIWGGGWLASAGFWDFAGSTVVHSVGGWAALAGIIVLGPVYTLVASFIFWFAIKLVFGLRVSETEELEGLDIGEHGQSAYVIPSKAAPASLV